MTEATTLPLDVLVHDEAANAGDKRRLDTIDDLMASIPEHGVLQSLLVRPIKVPGKGDKIHAVYAGNRRLAALKRLAAEGRIRENYPVPVIIKKNNDATAHELSAAENIQRLPMTAVEEFRAFARMRADKRSDDEIALHFGIPVRRVQQRARLAELHPEVLAALDAGEIGLDAAQAYTIEPNPELQRQDLAQHRQHGWQMQSHAIRGRLSKDGVLANSDIAKLVGEEAYLAAGGEIARDLFGDRDRWLSAAVVTDLVKAKWQDRIDAWLADGWSFVLSTDEFGRNEYGSELAWNADKLRPERVELEAQDAKELADVTERAAALWRQYDFLSADQDDDEEDDDENDWDEDDDEGGDDADDGDDGAGGERESPPAGVREEHRRLTERAMALEAARLVFTTEQKARSGIVYWPVTGKVVSGVLKPGEKADAGEASGSRAPKVVEAPDLDKPGDIVRDLCDGWLTEALQKKVQGDPELALQVAVAQLHVRMRLTTNRPGPLHLDGLHLHPAEAKPPQGEDFAAALAWARGQTQADLLIYLAQLVGENINCGWSGPASSMTPAVRALRDFVDPDTLARFDAAAYFDGLKKPQIAFAYELMTGLKLKDGKKGEMVATAAGRAKELGWLPPQLRTPSYVDKGVTAGVTAAPPAEEQQLQAAE